MDICRGAVSRSAYICLFDRFADYAPDLLLVWPWVSLMSVCPVCLLCSGIAAWMTLGIAAVCLFGLPTRCRDLWLRRSVLLPVCSPGLLTVQGAVLLARARHPSVCSVCGSCAGICCLAAGAAYRCLFAGLLAVLEFVPLSAEHRHPSVRRSLVRSAVAAQPVDDIPPIRSDGWSPYRGR